MGLVGSKKNKGNNRQGKKSNCYKISAIKDSLVFQVINSWNMAYIYKETVKILKSHLSTNKFVYPLIHFVFCR